MAVRAFCASSFVCRFVGLLQPASRQSASRMPSDVRARLPCLSGQRAGAALSKTPTDTLPRLYCQIMTGYLACRLLGIGWGIRDADRMPCWRCFLGRSLRLAAGEELTVRDLLYASLCGGYNDATAALAVLASGSVAEFVSR